MHANDVVRIHKESLYSTFKFVDDQKVTANNVEYVDDNTVLVNEVVLINLSNVKTVTYAKEGSKI